MSNYFETCVRNSRNRSSDELNYRRIDMQQFSRARALPVLVSALALLQPAYAPAHFIGANTVVNTETSKSLRIAIKPTQALQSVALATRGSELPTVRIAVKPSPLLVSLANALRGVGQPATKVGAAAVAPHIRGMRIAMRLLAAYKVAAGLLQERAQPLVQPAANAATLLGLQPALIPAATIVGIAAAIAVLAQRRALLPPTEEPWPRQQQTSADQPTVRDDLLSAATSRRFSLADAFVAAVVLAILARLYRKARARNTPMRTLELELLERHPADATLRARSLPLWRLRQSSRSRRRRRPRRSCRGRPLRVLLASSSPIIADTPPHNVEQMETLEEDSAGKRMERMRVERETAKNIALKLTSIPGLKVEDPGVPRRTWDSVIPPPRQTSIPGLAPPVPNTYKGMQLAWVMQEEDRDGARDAAERMAGSSSDDDDLAI